MTKFRPCIDLHDGRVKQIVGGSLRDGAEPATHHVSPRDAEWFAARYRRDGLRGGHVIQLGPGNADAARAALAAWPGSLQIGGGITADNALEWLEAGAAKLIATSWLFDESAHFQWDRLAQLSDTVGPDKLVVDLSCRRAGTGWQVAIHRWQTLSDLSLTAETLEQLAPRCAEFLVHAVDVEGLRAGMDEDLIRFLGDHAPRPTTYAGGARQLSDLDRVNHLSGGRVDLTIGAALDLFGGQLPYEHCVEWNLKHA